MGAFLQYYFEKPCPMGGSLNIGFRHPFSHPIDDRIHFNFNCQIDEQDVNQDILALPTPNMITLDLNKHPEEALYMYTHVQNTPVSLFDLQGIYPTLIKYVSLTASFLPSLPTFLIIKALYHCSFLDTRGKSAAGHYINT